MTCCMNAFLTILLSYLTSPWEYQSWPTRLHSVVGPVSRPIYVYTQKKINGFKF